MSENPAKSNSTMQSDWLQASFSLTPHQDIIAALPSSCGDCLPAQLARVEELAPWLYDSRLSTVEKAVALILERSACAHVEELGHAALSQINTIAPRPVLTW